MFKKPISIVLLLCITFLFTSCDINISSKNRKDDPSATPPKESAISLLPSSSGDHEPVSVTPGATYETIGKSYTDKDIKINYPQLINLSDGSKQEKINQLIKTEALKGLNYYPEMEDGLSLEINYATQWKGSNLLSIQYSGVGYVQGTAHPNPVFYTTNIDMNKGDKLRLTDLVTVDEHFVEELKKGVYKAWDPGADPALGSALMDELRHFPTESLLQKLNTADTLDSTGTEPPSDTFSYFTEDSLGISIGVASALGSHAEFEIKYADIANSIKIENEAWKDFLNVLPF